MQAGYFTQVQEGLMITDDDDRDDDRAQQRNFPR